MFDLNILQFILPDSLAVFENMYDATDVYENFSIFLRVLPLCPISSLAGQNEAVTVCGVLVQTTRLLATPIGARNPLGPSSLSGHSSLTLFVLSSLFVVRLNIERSGRLVIVYRIDRLAFVVSNRIKQRLGEGGRPPDEFAEIIGWR